MTVVVDAAFALDASGLRPDVRIIATDGRIVAIDDRVVDDLPPHDSYFGGSHALVTPALVNAHQHGRARSSVAMGIADVPLERWLLSLVASPIVDPHEEAYASGRRHVAAGTTTVVHSHGSAAATQEAFDDELRAIIRGYQAAGVRPVVAAEFRDRGLPVIGDEGAFLGSLPGMLRDRVAARSWAQMPADAAFEVVDGIRAEIAAGEWGDVGLVYGPPGPPWCSDGLLKAVAERAAARAIPVHTHLLESRYERAFGRWAYADDTVQGLDRLGLLGPWLSASHGVWLDAADIDTLAERSVTVVTNPSSNLRLHAGRCDVPTLLGRGVNVAIGTDNMTLGGGEELLAELRMLRALHRLPGIDSDGLEVTDLLGMATVAGAQGIGRPDVGRLAVGQSADLLVVDLASLRGPFADRADPAELFLADARPEDFEVVLSAGRAVAHRGVATAPPCPLTVERVDDNGEMASLAQEIVPYALAHLRRLLGSQD